MLQLRKLSKLNKDNGLCILAKFWELLYNFRELVPGNNLNREIIALKINR